MKLEHTIVINIKDKKPIDKKQTKCTQCEIDFLKKNYSKENNEQKDFIKGEHK
jgi:hypothetical protein